MVGAVEATDAPLIAAGGAQSIPPVRASTATTWPLPPWTYTVPSTTSGAVDSAPASGSGARHSSDAPVIVSLVSREPGAARELARSRPAVGHVAAAPSGAVADARSRDPSVSPVSPPEQPAASTATTAHRRMAARLVAGGTRRPGFRNTFGN